MKMGIIGRGRVAQALAKAFADSHELRLGVRSIVDPSEAEIGDVARWSDVILLATPWSAEEDVCTLIADHVANKPVIDATNPFGMRNGVLDLVLAEPDSAAEALQTRLPTAHVVKCFNQIGAKFLHDTAKLANTPAKFAVSDHATAKDIALTLARDAGFEAVDGGPLSNARHLESLAMIWIWSATKGPLGRSFGFALSQMKSKET